MTLTNAKGAKLSVVKRVTFAPIASSPVYYNLDYRYIPGPGNPMLYLQYYLNFYSDAALTQSNISQTQNIGFKYILWMYKYDKYNVLVSSGKLAEQTVILYPGTTTYTFPEKILNAVPYTLDNSVYEYEISEFGYR